MDRPTLDRMALELYRGTGATWEICRDAASELDPPLTWPQYLEQSEGPVVRMAHVEWHVHNHHPTATAYRIRVGTGDWQERAL